MPHGTAIACTTSDAFSNTLAASDTRAFTVDDLEHLATDQRRHTPTAY